MVRYAAPVWSATGYAQAARSSILALEERGYRVVLDAFDQDDEGDLDLGDEGLRLRELAGRDEEADVQILHSTPDLFQLLRRGSAPAIGVTVWETDRLHPIWAKACNRMDEVWVPCRWNREVFRRSGVEREVAVVPYAWDPSPVAPVLPRALSGLADGVFVFYAIFQWRERKNPEELVETFLATFPRDPEVALVLKTYSDDVDEDPAPLRRRIDEIKSRVNVLRYAPILLLSGRLSPAEVRGLHQRGDCFVLLQRAEGWGYPHLEAAAHGNPVVTTGYGGVLDFLDPDDPFLLDFQLRPVTGEPRSPYYTADGRWAAADLEQARQRMLRARERRPEDRRRAQRTRRRILRELSPQAVGARMAERIERLLQRTSAGAGGVSGSPATPPDDRAPGDPG